MEAAHCKIKRTLLMEEEKKVKRESEINQGETRANRRVFHLMKIAGVVSESVPPLICVSSYRWEFRRFKTGILSTRSLCNNTCLLINTTDCFTQPCHRTEIRVSRSN